MLKEFKENIVFEKKLKKKHVCRYNNQLFTIQYKRIKFLRILLCMVLVFLFVECITYKYSKEFAFLEDKKDIVFAKNDFVNSLIEYFITIVIMAGALLVIDCLSKVFWKLICAVKSAKYSDDFVIYDINYKLDNKKPISKYDYIFGGIFSTVLIGLFVVLIDSYIQYSILEDVYIVVFSDIVGALYLAFQKCDYILPSNSGYIYLNRKED